MKRRWLFVVACLALVVGFVVAAAWVKQRRAAELGFLAEERASLFLRPHSPTLGAEGAKVFLVEFTDPACETCAGMAPVLKHLLEIHAGKLRLVVRWAPFHEGADAVARILEATRRQDRFWETLELLYLNQGAWTAHHRVVLDRVWQLLPHAGVDAERLRRDLEDPAIAAIVEQDLADAQALGVRKTPGIFVNGRPLEPFGVQPLVDLVDDEVTKRYPGR